MGYYCEPYRITAALIRDPSLTPYDHPFPKLGLTTPSIGRVVWFPYLLVRK